MEKIVVYYISENLSSNDAFMDTVKYYFVSTGYLTSYDDDTDEYVISAIYDGELHIVPDVQYWNIDKNVAIQKCKELNKQVRKKINTTLKMMKEWLSPVEDKEASVLNMQANDHDYEYYNSDVIVYANTPICDVVIDHDTTYFKPEYISFYKYMKCFLIQYNYNPVTNDDFVTSVRYNQQEPDGLEESLFNASCVSTDLAEIKRQINRLEENVQLIEICNKHIALFNEYLKHMDTITNRT